MIPLILESVAAFLLGAFVGVGELIARYRDAPRKALVTVAGAVYCGINALASLAALLLINALGWDFGFGPATPSASILAEGIAQVLVAGFGAMAFFRSALFIVRVGDQDVPVGPASLLQTVLNATDRAVDRSRARARALHVRKVMTDISAAKAAASLPLHCIALMQNLSPQEQQAFADSIKDLYTKPLSNEVRVLNLGLLIMTYVGGEVLEAAISTLKEREDITGETPDIVISRPGKESEYGLNEEIKAAYRCEAGRGAPKVRSCIGTLENGQLMADGDLLVTSSLGKRTLTIEAEDEGGNRNSVSHVYTVIDRDRPELHLPPDDIVKEATCPDGARVFFAVAATDLDPPEPFVQCNHRSGDVFKVGETTVKCTAKDNQGNEATGYFKIIVTDARPPDLELPEVVSTEAANQDGTIVEFEEKVSATDIVDGNVEVRCNPRSGTRFRIGETKVECEATDKTGNKATGKFTVLVVQTNGHVDEDQVAEVDDAAAPE